MEIVFIAGTDPRTNRFSWINSDQKFTRCGPWIPYKRDTKAKLKQSNQYLEEISDEEVSNASRYSDISSNEYSSSDNYSSSDYKFVGFEENSYDSEDNLEHEDDSSTIIIELEGSEDEYSDESSDISKESSEESSEISSEEFGEQSNIIFGITTENGKSFEVIKTLLGV